MEEPAQGLTEFELERLRIIARNRARMVAMGIPQAVEGLKQLAPKAKAAPKPKAQQKAEPAAPTRASSRLRDQQLIAQGQLPPDVEEGSELAVFIIDGECPRCGKVLSQGHERHLQSCKGLPEPPTEEELAAQAEAFKQQSKERLRELELGGLVDYSPGSSNPQQQQQQPAAAAAAADDDEQPPAKRQRGATAAAAAAEVEAASAEEEEAAAGKRKAKAKAKPRGKKGQKAAAAAAGAGDADAGEAYATFIVIGSKGDHYKVKLTHAKRSCECMDHRIRRRDCKHIRLVWEQLGVSDAPQEWDKALERQLTELAAAEQADVQRVRQAEARAKERREKAAAKAAAQGE